MDRAKLCPSIFAARRQFDKLSDDGSLRYSDTNQRAPFAMSFARRVALTGSHKFCHDMPVGMCMFVCVRRACMCVCAIASRPCLEILIKSDDIASNSISECRLLILRTFPLLILCQYYIEPIIYTLKGCVPSQSALSLTLSVCVRVFVACPLSLDYEFDFGFHSPFVSLLLKLPTPFVCVWRVLHSFRVDFTQERTYAGASLQ